MLKKMETYNDSIVAKDGSNIKNAKISKTRFDKPSFWKGFISGILSSLIASIIFYLIMELIKNNAALQAIQPMSGAVVA